MPELEQWIKELIKEDKLYKFYKSQAWLLLRSEVLRDNHYECYHCMLEGKYTRAVMVHHVNEVRKRPDMALTKTYIDKEGQEQRNLVPLCFACHEKEHDRFGDYKRESGSERFTNDEKW